MRGGTATVAALASVLALTGCAPVPPASVPASAPVTAPGNRLDGYGAAQSVSDAQFRAARPGLRRVGYRNCDGYSVQLLVPRQVARDGGPQWLWWEITPYLAGANSSYRVTVPEDFRNWRTERRVDAGWQVQGRVTATDRRNTPRQLSFSAAEIGASRPVAQDLREAIGLGPDPLSPGSYRVQASDFIVETPSGGRCALRPFWVFDIQ